MARFRQVNLVARDLVETVAFYRRLGLEIAEDQIWRTSSGPHHVGAVIGEVDFEFDSRAMAREYNSGFQAERGGVVIGVAVDSRAEVDRLFGELIAAGSQGLQAPRDAFWGARVAILEDPDGNPVMLQSPSDPERRSPPPEI